MRVLRSSGYVCSFFRQASSLVAHNTQETTEDVSTEKCLVAANNIVRLVKLMKGSTGLSRAAPGAQLYVRTISFPQPTRGLKEGPASHRAAFSAGTVLALAAFPNEAESPSTDERSPDHERRAQAKKDLAFLVEALKEIGATWTTALTSAGVLEGKKACEREMHRRRTADDPSPPAIMLACEPTALPTVDPSPRQPQMPTPPLTDLSASVPLPNLAPTVPPLPPAFHALLNPPNTALLDSDPFARFQYGLGLSGSGADVPQPDTAGGLPPAPLPLGTETYRAMWNYGNVHTS